MMEKCNYRKDPHQDIDHVFRDLLPAHGMVERPAQVELSHQMLDTMLNGSIALCDAGTGIGKTYVYPGGFRGDQYCPGVREPGGNH